MIFKKYRTNPLIQANSLFLNYDQLLTDLEIGLDIDYLSVDIDPSRATFDALKKALSGKIKCKVITFEHSAMLEGEGQQVRIDSRAFLTNLGYVMIAKDVANIGVGPTDLTICYPVEDWWIDPSQVDMSIFEKLKCVSDNCISSYHTIYTGPYPAGYYTGHP